MTPRLPPSFYVIAGLGLLLIWATHVIHSQQVALDARPAVEDFKADARTEDVRRDPVTIKRRTETTAPDGTKKVVDSERIIGAVESHTEAKSESEHKETPVAAPRARTRYAGVGLNPLAYTREWRARAGLTVFGALDAGAAMDFDPVRLKFDRPMLELTYRW